MGKTFGEMLRNSLIKHNMSYKTSPKSMDTALSNNNENSYVTGGIIFITIDNFAYIH